MEPKDEDLTVLTMQAMGLEAWPIAIEASVVPGPPGIEIAGPDKDDPTARDTRVRVGSALACAEVVVDKRVRVDFSRWHLRSWHDLAIAVAVVQALRGKRVVGLNEAVVGELSLAGQLKPVRGLLPMLLAMGENDEGNIEYAAVPKASAGEASLAADRVCITAVEMLGDMFVRERSVLQTSLQRSALHPIAVDLDFREVHDARVKRAVMISAVTGLGLLLVGSPGTGKTMVARRIPTVMPPMSETEALDVAQLQSVAGIWPRHASALPQSRPFRAPHHTCSEVGLLGGGSPPPRPGEVSLAHNGVLYLDEIAEFRRRALEVLGHVVLHQRVTIARASAVIHYPAHALVVGSSNPCACGRAECTCSTEQHERYCKRLHEMTARLCPLRVFLQPVKYDDLAAGPSIASMTSEEMRAQIAVALARREQPQPISAWVYDFLMDRKKTDRVLDVARAIADLDGVAVGEAQVREAQGFLNDGDVKP